MKRAPAGALFNSVEQKLFVVLVVLVVLEHVRLNVLVVLVVLDEPVALDVVLLGLLVLLVVLVVLVVVAQGKSPSAARVFALNRLDVLGLPNLPLFL
jgi:hypothetical protein